jgi:hypothetical protein
VGIWSAVLGKRKPSPPQPPGPRLGEEVDEEAVRGVVPRGRGGGERVEAAWLHIITRDVN